MNTKHEFEVHTIYKSGRTRKDFIKASCASKMKEIYKRTHNMELVEEMYIYAVRGAAITEHTFE